MRSPSHLRRAAAASAGLLLAIGAPAFATSSSLGASTGTRTGRDHGAITLPGGYRAEFAAPADGKATGLVIDFHGHGHNGYQDARLLKHWADSYHVVAAAMITTELPDDQPSYRGPFQSIDEEARGAAAIITWARATFGTGDNTYLLATSMGGGGLAYFVDAATRSTAGDADAQLIQRGHPFPIKGMVLAESLVDLAETWAEATVIQPSSAAEIEAETGGTPLNQLGAYRARSIGLLTPAQWRRTGAKVASIVSAVDDSLAPYDQTVLARTVLSAAGITLRTTDVVFANTCLPNGSTLTSLVLSNKWEKRLCLAGHAGEADTSSAVMGTAFDELGQQIHGQRQAQTLLLNLTRPTR